MLRSNYPPIEPQFQYNRTILTKRVQTHSSETTNQISQATGYISCGEIENRRTEETGIKLVIEDTNAPAHLTLLSPCEVDQSLYQSQNLLRVSHCRVELPRNGIEVTLHGARLSGVTLTVPGRHLVRHVGHPQVG